MSYERRTLGDFSTHERNTLVVVYRRKISRLSQENASTAFCSVVSSNAEGFKFEVYLSSKELVFEQTSNMIFALS